jgi:hypothetical protein
MEFLNTCTLVIGDIIVHQVLKIGMLATSGRFLSPLFFASFFTASKEFANAPVVAQRRLYMSLFWLQVAGVVSSHQSQA